MIYESRCSYEVCKLLHEKGFDVKCTDWYWENNINIWKPTHQMAMMWLREVHGIFIAINNDDLDFNWQCCDLTNRDSNLDPKILSESYAGYKAYEEAVESALKYVLEKLI